MAGVCAAFVVLIVIAAGALKYATDRMEYRARGLQEAAHQVHLAEALRARLLNFDRLSNLIRSSPNPSTSPFNEQRAQVQGRFYHDFEELRRAASSPQRGNEIDKFGQAEKDVRAYMQERYRAEAGTSDLTSLTRATSPALEAALSSLDQLANEQSEREASQEERILTWSRRSDVISLVVMAISLVGVFAVIRASYRLIFSPLLGLVTSIRRFAGGERRARAEPVRVDELSDAANSFNQMADTIATEHSRMIDFVGGVARDLRDPVHLMHANLDGMPPNRPLPPEATMRTRLAQLGREVERIDRKVETFLDESRSQLEQIDLQQDRHDARAMVQDVVELYSKFSSLHQIVGSTPAQPMCIYAEPARLTQAIGTLISNAIEFSPGGGVVNVDATVAGGEAIIAVTDHGVGLSKEEVARIFAPFRRLTKAGSPGRGTAVGLAVARRIIEAHRGRLEVESKEGAGSTFRVHLPLADGQKEERTPVAPNGPRPAMH
jgi:signal transduction histidine kinase